MNIIFVASYFDEKPTKRKNPSNNTINKVFNRTKSIKLIEALQEQLYQYGFAKILGDGALQKFIEISRIKDRKKKFRIKN